MDAHSTFLYQGELSEQECADKCAKDARCHFITLAFRKPTPLCFNCEYCNSTAPFNKRGKPQVVATYARQ